MHDPELICQRRFVASAAAHTLRRPDELATLQAYAAGTSDDLFVLADESGAGKTTLLARWVGSRESELDLQEAQLCFRFIGAVGGAQEPYVLLRSLLEELQDGGPFTTELPDTPTAVQEAWPELLADAGAARPRVIVIDGLERLETGLAELSWIPRTLPDGVKLILGLDRDAPGGAELIALLQRDPVWLQQVPPLDHRELLCHALRSRPRLRASSAQIAALQETNPLRLEAILTALELEPDVDPERFGSGPEGALTELLATLERSLPEVAPALFGLLGAARGELTRADLCQLISRHLSNKDVDEAVEACLDRARRQLTIDDAGIRLGSASLHRAIRRHHGVGRWRAALTDYFGGVPLDNDQDPERVRRAVHELPHQLAQAGQDNRATQLLCDLRFVDAKVRCGRLFELQVEYAARTSSARSNATPLDELARFIDRDQPTLLKFGLTPGFVIQRARAAAADLPAVIDGADAALASGPAGVVLVDREPGRGRGPQTVCHARSDNQLTCVRLTHDGRLAVTGGHGSTLESIEVWDARTGDRPGGLDRVGRVKCLDLTPDGKTVAVGTDQGRVMVWDLASRTQVAQLQGEGGMINAVAIDASGRQVVFGGDDELVVVWHPGEERTVSGVRHEGRVTGIALTPDGTRVASCGDDGIVQVWYVDNSAHVRLQHAWEARAVAITPDGSTVASAGDDRLLCVWDVATGERRAALEGHDGSITSVALNANASLAVTGSEDDTLRVWDLRSGRAQVLRGHTRRVRGVSITPDGRHVASVGADRSLRVWDLRPRHAVQRLQGHATRVRGACVSSDGRFGLTCADENVARGWDLESGERSVSLEHADWVRGVNLSEDASAALTGSSDGGLSSWRLNGGAAVGDRIGTGHAGWLVCSVTPDGRRAVTGGRDEVVSCWELPERTQRWRLEDHESAVTSVSIDRKGRTAASGSYDGTVRIWDVEGGACRHVLSGHRDVVLGVALLSDASAVVSGGMDGAVRVWDLDGPRPTARHVLAGHDAAVTGVAVTADGRLGFSSSEDFTVRVWDLRRGVWVGTYLAGAAATCCAYGGSTLLVGTEAGGVQALEVLSEQTTPPPGHAFEATLAAASWSPTAPLIVVGGADGSAARLEFHEPDYLELHEQYEPEEAAAVREVAWTGRGEAVVVTDAAGGKRRIVFWGAGDGPPCPPSATSSDGRFGLRLVGRELRIVSL